MTLILARGIGEAFVARDATRERIAGFLAKEIGPPESGG
jgi:hypothetical protein